MRDKPPKGIRYFNTGPWPVFIGFTSSEKAFKAECKRLDVGKVDFLGSQHANATTHVFTSGGSICFIITIQPPNRRATREMVAGLIAHEAMHVIQEMQKSLAQGRSLGDEAEAYLVQQIVQECLQDLWCSRMVRRTEPTA